VFRRYDGVGWTDWTQELATQPSSHRPGPDGGSSGPPPGRARRLTLAPLAAAWVVLLTAIASCLLIVAPALPVGTVSDLVHSAGIVAGLGVLTALCAVAVQIARSVPLEWRSFPLWVPYGPPRVVSNTRAPAARCSSPSGRIGRSRSAARTAPTGAPASPCATATTPPVNEDFGERFAALAFMTIGLCIVGALLATAVARLRARRSPAARALTIAVPVIFVSCILTNCAAGLAHL
jgi:hypothetical protein